MVRCVQKYVVSSEAKRGFVVQVLHSGRKCSSCGDDKFERWRAFEDEKMGFRVALAVKRRCCTELEVGGNVWSTE